MRFEVNILGSGSALPILTRNPSSQYVVVQERHMLIDCGEGTQLQLRKSKFKFQKINHIFISHLHGDHYLGLVGLLSTFNLLGRKNPIHIYGPNELKTLLDLHFKSSQSFLNYSLTFYSTNSEKPEQLYEDKVLKVSSFPLKHKIPCCGFIIREKTKLRSLNPKAIEKHQIPIEHFHNLKLGKDLTLNNKLINNELVTFSPPKSRSYAYCSDTKYCESIVKEIKNVDLLYHESTFLEDKKELANKTYHSTALDAAKIAKKSSAKKLLLGHYSARYNSIAEFEKEAKTIFNNVIAVKDGDTFEIEIVK